MTRDSLCMQCSHRQSVVSKERGEVVSRCQVFGRSMYNLGHVTNCTQFSNMHNSVLFAHTAWEFRIRKDGSRTFVHPNTPYED